MKKTIHSLIDKSKTSRQGFTLVEVIVILIILAILAAILVPQLLGYIDRGNARACELNRAALTRYYKVANALDYNKGGLELAAFIANSGGKYDSYIEGNAMLTCPSGGRYSVSADGTQVLCSLHDGVLHGLNPNYVAYLDLKKALDHITSSGVSIGNRIDSGSEDGPRTKAMVQYLASLDPPVHLEEHNIQSWAVVKEGNNPIYWWSDQSIESLNEGTRVRVIRYNPVRDTYTAGYMTVSPNTLDGVTYNVLTGISGWTEEPGQTNASKAEYAATVEIYNELDAVQN